MCEADRRNQLTTACRFCYIRPAPGVFYMNAAQTRDTGAIGTPFIIIKIIITNQGRYKLSSIFIIIGRQWGWFISMFDHSNHKKDEEKRRDMEVKSDSFCFIHSFHIRIESTVITTNKWEHDVRKHYDVQRCPSSAADGASRLTVYSVYGSAIYHAGHTPNHIRFFLSLSFCRASIIQYFNCEDCFQLIIPLVDRAPDLFSAKPISFDSTETRLAQIQWHHSLVSGDMKIYDIIARKTIHI